MTEIDGLPPLGVAGLTRLLALVNRGAESFKSMNSSNLAQSFSRVPEDGVPPRAATLVFQKLSKDAATSSDFTPAELRLINAVRRYDDSKQEIDHLHGAFVAAAREWAEENFDLIQDGIVRAIDDHLSGQTSVVATLTDEEIRRTRWKMSEHSRLLAAAFSDGLARRHEFVVEDTVDAVADALLTKAAPVRELEVLRVVPLNVV